MLNKEFTDIVRKHQEVTGILNEIVETVPSTRESCRVVGEEVMRVRIFAFDRSSPYCKIFTQMFIENVGAIITADER